MVNTWFGREPGEAPRCAGRTRRERRRNGARLGRRCQSPPSVPGSDQARGGPSAAVHQPVLLARPRLDGAAPDRPGRVAGRRGARVPRPLRQGSYKPGDAAAAGVRDPQRRAHPPRPRHVAGPAEHPVPDDRLPELLRPGAALAALRSRGSTWSSTLTTPPIIGLVGTILRRLKGTRHVYWSMDLHPDASLALGRMSRTQPGGRVARLAERRRVPPGRQGRGARPVHGRPDRSPSGSGPTGSRRSRSGAVATRSIPCPATGHPLRESLGLADKFVAMYSGNLGLAHSFDEFLEAARRLRDRPDIVFLFVGDGPRMAEVRAAQQARGADEHPVPRLLPPRAAARLALGGRRPPDLDAARDDRDRRAGQALRRDGLGPPRAVRRPGPLRVGRHDPPGRLRPDGPPGRRRRPGRGTRPRWPTTPSSSAQMGAAGPRGVPRRRTRRPSAAPAGTR